MNKSYKIKKMDDNNIWVFATDYLRIDDYIKDLEFDLRKINFSGNVFFDLILSNGPKLSGRFFSALFDGENFNISSFKNLSEVTSEILSFVDKYHKEHLEFIDKSILTKPQKFLFKRKLLKNGEAC